MSASNLEVLSPNVQIDENYIEVDYEYQTSSVKRDGGKIQVSNLFCLKIFFFFESYVIFYRNRAGRKWLFSQLLLLSGYKIDIFFMTLNKVRV